MKVRGPGVYVSLDLWKICPCFQLIFVAVTLCPGFRDGRTLGDTAEKRQLQYSLRSAVMGKHGCQGKISGINDT